MFLKTTTYVRLRLLIATLDSDKYSLIEKMIIIDNLDEFLGIKK